MKMEVENFRSVGSTTRGGICNIPSGYY